MRQRAGRDRRGTARVRLFLQGLLGASAALATGCSTLSKDSAQFEAPDYQLGGQTGSLIPGCGIAPLSAGGQSVPVGRSLAVFYAKDCPQLAAEGQLALSGVAGNAQQLELVRIADGTYLLQSAQSLPAGDYQLELAAGESALHVSEAEVEVPAVFGQLNAATEPCADVLRFTLPLDDVALALAPLARFELRIDGGEQQLWVDYGALRIERDDAGDQGVLELPLCTQQGCLSPGSHQLELTVSVAGQSRAPAPLPLDFDVCPALESEGDGASDDGCALAAPARSQPTRLGIGGLCLALALGGCRAARVQRRRTPRQTH